MAAIRDPERMRRLLDLLGQALDRPAAERAAFVAAMPETDTEIRAGLARMLELDTDSPALAQVEGGAAALVTPAPDEEEERKAGEHIGDWVLERPLGRGGMGTVWLARKDGDASLPPVAIKMPTTGGAGRGAAERLAREGAILAALNHPNIARLVEAGASGDGQPFLALEYVAGQSLPAWCDARNVGIRERLALFVKVLDAVAYAHAALVLHRDLKPGNVLVTQTGEVKLLDFGIAKLMDDTGAAGSTQLTRLAGRALTPDYASPEQVAGIPLTVASDVYSLGVMLFELLTGGRPYRLRRGSAAELEEAILTADTARPSAAVTATFAHNARETPARLKRAIAGDLDTIILKALKKSPAERYPSALALKDDIERYLGGRPVLARADSAGYRTRKFILRHKLAVGAGAAVLASLVIGLAAALWQAGVAREQSRLAEAQRERAEQRFDDVRAMANSLITEVAESIQYLPGATQARERITAKAVEFLDKLAADPRRDDALARELAGGYQRVAEALNGALYANQGDAQGANRNYDKALSLLQPLASRVGATAADRAAYAGAALSHGVNLLEQGRVDEALAHTRRGLELRLALLAESPDDIERSRDVGTAETYLANVLAEKGDLAGALAANESVRARFRAMVERDPRSARNRWGLICGYSNTGSILAELRRDGEARERLLRAVTLNLELQVDRPDHYSVLQGFGAYHHILAEIAIRGRDWASATAHLEESLRRRRDLAARDANDVEAAINLARTQATLGLVRAEQGRREGLALIDGARASLAGLSSKRPDSRRVETARIEILAIAARARLALREPREACARIAEATTSISALQARHPSLASLSRLELPDCPSRRPEKGADPFPGLAPLSRLRESASLPSQ